MRDFFVSSSNLDPKHDQYAKITVDNLKKKIHKSISLCTYLIHGRRQHHRFHRSVQIQAHLFRVDEIFWLKIFLSLQTGLESPHSPISK